MIIQEKKTNIPLDVKEACDNYLSLVDRYLSEKIKGLYLVGSIALNDYHSGKSDIDFVAVCDDHLS